MIERSQSDDKKLFHTQHWWDEARQHAADLAIERASDPTADTTLLTIAAQHPLQQGVWPGSTFANRLDRGLELFWQSQEWGHKMEILVACSRHHDAKTNQTDLVTLSDAGRRYLIGAGVPKDLVHGDEWNQMYLPGGVYSGADEMLVASKAFIDNPKFENLIYVASPGQINRAELYGVANGIIPSYASSAELINDPDSLHGDPRKQKFLELWARYKDPTGQGWLLDRIVRQNRIPTVGGQDTV